MNGFQPVDIPFRTPRQLMEPTHLKLISREWLRILAWFGETRTYVRWRLARFDVNHCHGWRSDHRERASAVGQIFNSICTKGDGKDAVRSYAEKKMSSRTSRANARRLAEPRSRRFSWPLRRQWLICVPRDAMSVPTVNC